MSEYNYDEEAQEDLNDWQCPECGWNSEEGDYERDFLGATPQRSVPAVQMQFGGNPVEWDETWRCRDCNTIWEFTVCSY